PFVDFLVLVLVVSMVIIAEILNTAIEMFSDMFFDQYHVQIRKIKDVAASAVLVSAITSVIIGYLIFARYFPPSFRNAFENLAESPWYFTFIVLFFIGSLYIMLKSLIRKQALISGGMPSIHSGIAFSIWVIVSMLTFKSEPLVSVLVLLLAMWVAQGRIIKHIHTLEETVIGAIFGILLTVLLFQIVERFTISQ
ncbi:MAG: diacylglycerol kinase, partial [Candidatus Omnitrophica bacterium]|nr:diacylglycerol kinase [Candidatus Omnitrophota bacterium]